MKKGILLIVAVGIIIGSALVPSDNTYSNSGVTPPGYTNAPGDQTCAKSGCHSDGTPIYNDGTISLSSVTPNISNGYTTGTLYHLYVNMGSGATYGFQLTAVDGNGHAAGTFALTDTSHTVLSLDTANGRQYVGSKNDGNAGLAFEWTAPATSETVYFYLAVVDGNSDGTDNGDQVRLKAYQATTSSFDTYNETAGISSPINADDAGIKIFPNPVKDQLNLTYAAPANETVKADIYGVNGQLVMPLFEENGAVHTTKSININNQLSSGIYIVRMAIGNNTYFKKILVQE